MECGGHDFDASGVEGAPKLRCELGIPVDDQVALPVEESFDFVGEITRDLGHRGLWFEVSKPGPAGELAAERREKVECRRDVLRIVMISTAKKTLLLGAEYDDALREALRDTLAQLGAKGLSRDWGVGGSQEVETVEVRLGANRVFIEAETFVGLSICGPVDLVERIQGMVAAAIRRS